MNEEALRTILEDFINKLKAVLAPVVQPAEAEEGKLSMRTLMELVSHEGIV